MTLVSDNKYLVEAVNGNLPIVTYEKQKAKEQRINPVNFASMDVRSFNSPIGGITNLASTLISMLSEFPEDSKEYKEISKRIDIMRRKQGDAIDATKGMVYVPPPSYWNKKQKYIPIPENATEEQIELINKKNSEIYFNNRICASTKPYFFGYVYDRDMKKYKEHKNEFNSRAEESFNKKLSDIMNSSNCTEDEKKLKKDYYKYMPLRRNNSIMNILSYYVEDVEFDNKWNKKCSGFNYKVLMKNEDFVPSNSQIKIIKEKCKYFFKEYKNITIMERQFEEFSGESYEYEDTYKYLYEAFSKDIFNEISNIEELCDCMIYVFYNIYKSFNRDVLWNVFGEQIINNLKCKTDKFCYVCEDVNGEEYLGKNYKLVEVDTNAVII